MKARPAGPVGFVQIFTHTGEAGAFFALSFLFVRPSTEAVQEYDEFFETQNGSAKWIAHPVDEIVSLFTDAAVVIRAIQEEQQQADLAEMMRWGRFKKWIMELAQWRPCVVQTIQEVRSEIAQRCDDMAELFMSTGKTDLVHKARVVGKKIQQA